MARTVNVDFAAYGPPAKRRKDDVSRFSPGNIYRVRVFNFTTYDYAEFKLSPSLNMIIGPNGSGKSTLVAAICLGLGGKPELIKRKNIKSLIKSGRTEATTQITLVGQDRQLVEVERVFSDKSAWKINRKTVSEKDVRQLCSKYNIQLDNLCHFLPQERVAEFAGMSPEKLLLETEKTLASGDLFNMHQDLVSIDEKRESVVETLAKSAERIARLDTEREKLEREVERFQQYHQKARELENHRYLLPFAILEDEKHRKAELKRQRDVAKKRLQEFNANADPLREHLATAEAELQEQKREISDIENTMRETKDDMDESKKSSKSHYDEIQKLSIALEDRKTSSARKAEELQKLSDEIQELLASQSQIPDVDESEISELKSQRNTYHDEVNEVSSSLAEIGDTVKSFERRVKEYKGQVAEEEKNLNSNDRLAIIAPTAKYQNKLQKSTFDLHVAMRKQPEFEGKYFECPIVSCQVKERRYSKFVERAIGNNNLMSITLTSRDTFNELTKGVLKRHNAPVRVVTERAAPSPYPLDILKRFGFEGYLSDYIEGPQEVLNMINSTAKLNFIPVSSKPLTEDHLASLLKPVDGQRLPFMKFVAGDELFTIYRSKYGSQQCMYNTESLQNARFFDKVGMSAEAKQAIKERIQGLKDEIKKVETEHSTEVSKLNEMQTQKESVSHRMEEIVNELHRLQNLKKEKDKKSNLVNAKRRRQLQLKQEMQETTSTMIKEIKNDILQGHIKLSSTMAEYAELTKQYSSSRIDLNNKQILVIQTQNKISILNSLIEEFGQYKENLERAFLAAQEKYKAMTNNEASGKIREQRDKYAEGQEQEIADLASDYIAKKILTQSHVEDRIHSLEQEQSLMSTADFGSVNKLAKIKEDIENETRQVPRLEREKSSCDDRIADIRRKWEPELSSLVEKISNSFKKRFSSVASDGQVELSKSERFKDWKLQILVKFREDADLKILDRQSQSGGERAVSTIFFIMALQGLTNAPFRVVDEINQGMDPKNERAVHKYLVHTACSNSKSQYFLVTPKLLTGLYYHKDMVVHCIYTGPFIDPSNKDVDDFLDLRNLIESH